MNTKFTKGKWEIFTKKQINDGAVRYRVNEGKMSLLEGIANAHLIAAAPDMYKELYELRSSLLGMIDCGIVAEQHFDYIERKMMSIDIVLAKARGEQC
tara:strand:- start:433 stop:726 length:294 start_codon:yes stop_codon:yes gene_type:complete